MPRRGYRKGETDTKTPRPHLLRCRASSPTLAVLDRDADARSLTRSSLIAEILDAFAADRRLELPHASTNAAALRELARLGNNLNQIAHHANLMRLHLLQADVRACLTAINDVARRLVG